MVNDDQVSPAIAGLSLRRLHDARVWPDQDVAAAFSRHVVGEAPVRAGAFVENFLGGAGEVLIQDQALLGMVDDWLCDLDEETFVDSLPLLRRAFGGFDGVGRTRLMQRVLRGRQEAGVVGAEEGEDNPAFDRALPLLRQILGIAS